MINTRSIISNLSKDNYFLEVVDSEPADEFLVVRSTISNENQVISFVNDIEKKTNTKFNPRVERKEPKRFIFRKKWICQHASYKKDVSSKRNLACTSFIDVMIKKVTENTRKKDNFLRRDIPYVCSMKLNLEHTHHTDTADALKFLRISPETEAKFEEYFSNGMTPSEARQIHENKLLVEEKYDSLANASYNPTRSQLYFLYDKWRKKNFGTTSEPFEKLNEKISKFESEGTIVKYVKDTTWSILIMTPVMQRVQKLRESSEIIFLDYTSGCEASGSALTLFIVATKAGGIPMAVFLHQAQTAENYINAFRLLKESSPQSFGGKEVKCSS